MRRAFALLAGFALVVTLVPSAAAYTVTSVGAAYVTHTGSISVTAGASISDAVNTADDGKFVQMAPVSTITLAFPAGTYAAPDGTVAADLTVHTFDFPYPAEATVQVYVKSNTNAWVPLGMIKDYAGDVGLNLEGVGLVNEVRLVQDGYIDPAYPTLGFDLDAVTTDHAVVLTESCASVTPGVYPGWAFQSTVFVSAVGPGSSTPVVTTPALIDGVGYRFEAKGLYSAGPAIGAGTEILADARYSQRVVGQATPGDSVYGYEGYGPTLLDLLLDGAAAEWMGAAFNANHAYTADLVGTGGPVTLEFQVYDIAAQNNIGGLCVSLYADEIPIADPNGPYLVPVFGTVLFDGSGSYDPDPDPDSLTYVWTAGGGTLNDNTLEYPTYTAGATAGIYPVSLVVTDEGGVASDEVFTTVVVYDPAGGFVTGGGWFYSEPGAYATDLTLEGKATFGFVSKYKKGADIPEGSTEFQFKAGNLNFHSSSYEWLVVTGSDYAMFKGTGTINGEGAYKFMIWAGDDEPDTFRIKIWTEDSGVETVVYDNGSDQAIGGGSIVIHTKK